MVLITIILKLLYLSGNTKKQGYTAPFTYLGTCEYVRHYGEKPISFIWRLNEEMPPGLVPKANKSIV